MNQYEHQSHHDATVTADDIRQDRNLANAEAAAEMQANECEGCGECTQNNVLCDQCQADYDADKAREETFWNARLAARAAAIITAAGGLALALSLTGTPASAHTLPLVPTDGECVITHQWDDGSAIALCGPDDAWAYDADGNTPPESSGYTGPRWDAGWYPCVDASCARIDHTS